jgi:hypothetical protein
MTMLPSTDELGEACTSLALCPDVARTDENGEFKSAYHHFSDFAFEAGRSQRSRNDPCHGRAVIAETGRAGTTLLVQSATVLCFDDDQETILSKLCYKTVRLSLRSNLNLATIGLPRFARNADYLWDTSQPVSAVCGVTQSNLSIETAAACNMNIVSRKRC